MNSAPRPVDDRLGTGARGHQRLLHARQHREAGVAQADVDAGLADERRQVEHSRLAKQAGHSGTFVAWHIQITSSISAAITTHSCTK